MYKEMGNLRATFISLFSQCRRGTIPFSPGVPFLFPECSLVLIACRLSGCHSFSSISLSFERSKGCTKIFQTQRLSFPHKQICVPYPCAIRKNSQTLVYTMSPRSKSTVGIYSFNREKFTVQDDCQTGEMIKYFHGSVSKFIQYCSTLQMYLRLTIG